MGHIFQMKPKIALTYAGGIGWLLLLIVVQLTLVPALPQAAVGEYEYKQKDKAAEKKKSIQRLEQDKRKVAMAIETTKTLIDRSRQRPYLPELYLRLAELYIEKSRIVYYCAKAGKRMRPPPSINWNPIRSKSRPSNCTNASWIIFPVLPNATKFTSLWPMNMANSASWKIWSNSIAV